MNIGEKLRKLRLQRELTQEEMADRCELSKGFISQVERDLASPSIATLTDMLECLGSNLKEFFSETEEFSFSKIDSYRGLVFRYSSYFFWSLAEMADINCSSLVHLKTPMLQKAI